MSNDLVREDLAERWKAYFEAIVELELVYEELALETYEAKAKKYEIPGVRVMLPGDRIDHGKAVEYATKEGWEIPYITPDPKIDNAALQKLFKTKDVLYPKADKAGSVSKKK